MDILRHIFYALDKNHAVFQVIIRLRFPRLKSVAEATWKRYKTQLKSSDNYRLRKAQISLESLVNCTNNSVVPKFFYFDVATKFLKCSRTYQECELSLLHERICQKISDARVLDILHSAFHTETSSIDFAYVRSLFSGHSDKVLKNKNTIHQKKFSNLLKDKKLQHSPNF